MLIVAELDYDEAWSEDGLVTAPHVEPATPIPSASAVEIRMKRLEAELEQARAEAHSLRNLLRSSVENDERDEPWIEVSAPGVANEKGKGKARARGVRDDDSHYFDSYAENGQFSSGCRTACPAIGEVQHAADCLSFRHP